MDVRTKRPGTLLQQSRGALFVHRSITARCGTAKGQHRHKGDGKVYDQCDKSCTHSSVLLDHPALSRAVMVWEHFNPGIRAKMRQDLVNGGILREMSRP